MRKENRFVGHLNANEGYPNRTECFLFSFSFLLSALVSSSEENHYIVNQRCQ